MKRTGVDNVLVVTDAGISKLGLMDGLLTNNPRPNRPTRSDRKNPVREPNTRMKIPDKMDGIREDPMTVDTETLVEKQREYFNAGGTKNIDFRIRQLTILRNAIRLNEKEITDALNADLGKSPFEGYATEIGFILDELRYTTKHLRRWAKPVKVKTPIVHFPSSSRIFSEPFGVSLVMSPWNYPFQLAMAPVMGSMAAGNCTVLKPSEYSLHTAEILQKIAKENFDEEYFTVVRGGRDANKTLLDEKFDYIFFTGSVAVGKAVMEAASRNLTPVSLELGGKSPCIVDETAKIDLAARRITWGKFLNAGQTCVAPDYLLVHSSVKDRLLLKIAETVTRFYGTLPYTNQEYPKIINEKHFTRLLGLLQGGHVVTGGQYDDKTLRIAPTVLDSVTWESAVMQEEIFGPILPVLEFEDIKEAVAMVNARPKPLALYLFTNDADREKFVLGAASFGGGCVNDTIVHLATPYMPFGGVGASGMGVYHGKDSFDTFSHRKSILKKSNLIDVPLRYPPYRNHLKLLKMIMK